MEVVIDGSAGWTAPAGATLAAVIETVKANVGRKRRRITGFDLDGHPLTDDDLAKRGAEASDGHSLLEVRTTDPNQLSLMALAGVSAHLKNLEKAHADASEYIRANEYSRATAKLGEIYSGWDILSRAVRDVASLGSVELSTLQAGAIKGDACVKSIQETLLRFETAMEFGDVVHMATITEQELAKILPQMKSLLAGLGGKLVS